MSDKNAAAPLTIEELQKAVAGNAAAFRCRRRLQPAGGEGDKVFPPTYAGGVYAVELRRVPGHAEPVTCVLLDSVQSQANRMELALHEHRAELNLPIVEVDFTAHDPTGDLDKDKADPNRLLDAVGKISTLQAPHRLADAILRDSEIDEGEGEKKTKVLFRKSKLGSALNTASPQNATPLFQLCPTALLFGMWDSTGPKGGLGAKFERALVSEVIGMKAEVGDLLRGVRRDPLEIRAKVAVLRKDDQSWFVAADPKAKGALTPSEINHSSVPFPKVRDKKTEDNRYSGVTIEYAEQVTTLSLICFRRLKFQLASSEDLKLSNTDDNQTTLLARQEKADLAARTVLAALGLCAATLAFENGLGLRSRCLLWPDGVMEWELLAEPGKPPVSYAITSDDAKKLLAAAVAAAETVGLQWPKKTVTLKPSKELLELVRKSQEQATKETETEAKP